MGKKPVEERLKDPEPNERSVATTEHLVRPRPNGVTMKARVILCVLGTSFAGCSADNTGNAATAGGGPTGAEIPGAMPSGGDATSGATMGAAGGVSGQTNPPGAMGGTSAIAGATMGGTGLGGSGVGAGAGGAGTGGMSESSAGAGMGGLNGGMGAGTGGMSAGGMGALPGSGDDFVSDVSIQMHDDVRTILVVTWTQTQAAEQVWLEFSFEDGNVMTSRAKAGETGPHRDVVLGVPGETDVSVRIVSSQGGEDFATMDYEATTGAVPQGMPEPEVISFDPEIASPDRFMFGAVEDSVISGSGDRPGYYVSTFWIYIIDRKGRIVWYFSDPSTNAISSFQRIARDGEYIFIEQTRHHDDSDDRVIKRTLDGEYYEEVEVEFTDCIDVTGDGSLLFDQENPGVLRELTRDGQTRDIFSCADHFGAGFNCYTNTVNYNPIDDTVVMSYPHETTVIEVSRSTGEVVGQYGTAPGSYAFEPATWGFEFQHFANISLDGTLMVSTHLPGNNDTTEPVANQHAFAEFTIDRENQTLTEKWVYTDGPEWPMYKGMAMKLPNGNVLANYGTGGTIREITQDKQTAFHVKFDVPDGDDFFNKMVGNNVLIDDLYALNGGPQ